jgi:hypothetical protein
MAYRRDDMQRLGFHFGSIELWTETYQIVNIEWPEIRDFPV